MRHAPVSPELFIRNRERLSNLLLPNSIAVVNANDVLPTNADGTLPLIPNSDLFYLSGIEQEESILVLFPQASDPRQKEILFLRKPIPELETWEGHKLTKAEAQKISGIKSIHWLSDFHSIFHRLMCECEHVYLNSNEHGRAAIAVETREARFVQETIRRYPLHDYQRLARVMQQLRVVKSEAEVRLIDKAAEITGKAFERVLGMIKPGVTETEVEAEFAYEFIRNRARFAYTPIIASGKNANVLHYIENSDVCRKGDLLLLDVAANYANYNSDMTRTIPVSGKFSRRQKHVYNAVLRVLRQCGKGLVPGKKWKEWQSEAEQAIERECVELGLLKMADIRKQDPNWPAVKKYFMHGVGHPLGLDVHDVGLLSRPMQAGWVMTVEPGIYIAEEGFGIRLENDYLITANGPVDLMAHIPIEADEIESRIANR
jgi:Xaa-Pro aminopeptidase